MPSQDKHKRKRQDEIVLQPVDSLKLMFEYLDIKFLAIQDQIDQKYWVLGTSKKKDNTQRLCF